MELADQTMGPPGKDENCPTAKETCGGGEGRLIRANVAIAGCGRPSPVF